MKLTSQISILLIISRRHVSDNEMFSSNWYFVSLFTQLDCGIHPGLNGFASLPFLDLVEVEEVDLLLISQ